jgi:HEAT repeat protein
LATSNSQFGAKQLLATLCSQNGTVIINALEEIDKKQPTRIEAQVLKKAFELVKDPTLSFQIKKSFRLAIFKLKGSKFKVSIDGLEKLLKDYSSRLDDLALGIVTVEPAEAFLALDLIRQSNWNTFPAEILPCFCNLFKAHGSIQDSANLQELTRHPDATVATTALSALEHLDPENIQGILTPLLSSPNAVIRGQAIQSFYRLNKGQATQHLLTLLFSSDENSVILALHHAHYFPFEEIEPYLLKLISECENPAVLMRISQLMKQKANLGLPFKLYWITKSLQSQHQSFAKGILLGVVRSLADKKLINCSAQEYLNQLKEQVKKEELARLKSTCNISDSSNEEGGLLSIESLSDPQPETESESGNSSPKSSTSKIVSPELDLDRYSELTEKQKIQLLAKLNNSTYEKLKPKIKSLLKETTGREAASIINAMGKFGEPSNAEIIKPYLTNEDPNIVCAAIKALSKLDSDYLCLYLPQYMQDKNGKIRMTATRVFMSIDRESIKSLVASLLNSSSLKQRTLGVSTSTLVDFNLVKEALIDALANEKSIELIEKMGVVLAANPDRELLNKTYAKVEASSASLKDEKREVLSQIAEKLSISLNKISSPEELLKQAKDSVAQSLKKPKTKQADIKPASKNTSSASVADDQKLELPPLDDNKDIKSILSSKDNTPKTKRAKATIIIIVIGVILWAVLFVNIILRFFGG